MKKKTKQATQQELMQLAAKYAQQIEDFTRQHDMDVRAVMLACSLFACGLTQYFKLDLKTYLETQEGLWDVALQLRNPEDNDEETKDSLDTAEAVMQEFFTENPHEFEKLRDAAKARGDEFLFSPEIRKSMAPFSQKSVKECLRSEDFFRAVFKHAGCSDEEFEEIKKKVKNETKSDRR